MLTMNTKKFDWENSLKSEQAYWLEHKERICSKEWLEHVRKRTKWFLDWYKYYGSLNDGSKVLQVGSGAEGEINFLEKGRRFAIDPLTDFYKLHFGHIMDQQVDFLKGRGENLPFEDDSFDLVITFNSLDHTENPSKVLSETSRILKKGGIVYIGVHIRSEYGHFLFEGSKKHKTITNHYYSYTKRLLKKEVRNHSFLILDERGETKLEKTAISRPKRDREADSFKRFLRFLIGRYGSTFHLLAKKV